MHAKEANVNPVDFLKCKHGPGSVREGLVHLTSVYESVEIKPLNVMQVQGNDRIKYLFFIPGFTSTVLSPEYTTRI